MISNSKIKKTFEISAEMSFRKMSFELLSPSSFRCLIQSKSRRVIPVDATWYLPNANKDGRQEFQQERIPNSLFYDIKAFQDPDSPYPHMLPSVDVFNASASQLGIKKDDILVFYDKAGNFSAPRAAWTFALFGHKTVYLLNNFAQYKQSQYPLDTSPVIKDSPYEPSQYVSEGQQEGKVISYEEYMELIQDQEAFVQHYTALDARPYARFTGEAAEPRAGMASGHVPGSKSLPYTSVLDPETKQILTPEELKEKFAAEGITDDKPFIVSCGSGVTAVVIKTALEHAGYGSKGITVYDGSWSEWGARAPPSAVATGP